MKNYSQTVTNNHVNVRGFFIKDVCFHHYPSHPDATVRNMKSSPSRALCNIIIIKLSRLCRLFSNMWCIQLTRPSEIEMWLTSLIMCCRDSSSLIPGDSVRLLSEPTFSRLPECIFRVKTLLVSRESVRGDRVLEVFLYRRTVLLFRVGSVVRWAGRGDARVGGSITPSSFIVCEFIKNVWIPVQRAIRWNDLSSRIKSLRVLLKLVRVLWL